jgi:hypothetical protein
LGGKLGTCKKNQHQIKWNQMTKEAKKTEEVKVKERPAKLYFTSKKSVKAKSLKEANKLLK